MLSPSSGQLHASLLFSKDRTPGGQKPGVQVGWLLDGGEHLEGYPSKENAWKELIRICLGFAGIVWDS